jgi:hypothetical protein
MDPDHMRWVSTQVQHGSFCCAATAAVPHTWVPQREHGFVVDDALRSTVRFPHHNLVDLPPPAPRGAGTWSCVATC